MKKAGIFSCLGLGDGLISFVLAQNLHLNGYETTTFHPFLSSMQEWFPHFSIQPPPQEIKKTLDEFDRIFIFLEKSAFMAQVISCALQFYREKTTILNPIATPNQDYPYWEEGRFNGKRSFVENLYTFSGKILRFPVCSKSNGITPPGALTHRKEKMRVLIHPTSSREGKNWPWEKFLELADKLKERGLTPVFLLTKEERSRYIVEESMAPLFPNLNALAAYIYESGYFIGNDSGPGHLASCLNIPTVSIFRNQQTANFWRPGWAQSRIACPKSWIPNIKGLRWRDRYWQKWISVADVLHRFFQLCKPCDKGSLDVHFREKDIVSKS